jgi:hypothetical protein
MKYSIVLTTINIPTLLKDYAKNFVKFGHQNEVEILVIGDKKTPTETELLMQEIREIGVPAQYFDIEKQEKWLEKFPDLKSIIPYNSDNRRNIGYLMAVENGAEIILAIDDDNFVDPLKDYLADQSIVGKTMDFEAIYDKSGWFNICSMMKFEPERKIYPRGYPYYKRFKDGEISINKVNGRIVINEGLWFQDPDIDSVTRLTENVKGVEVLNEQIFLDKGTFSPINTQNTAFHKDILPCLYFVLMGGNINGLVIERYGDIWFGLFAKKIIDHMGDYISFGKPFAIHKRNTHNLLKDLKWEFWAIMFTETLSEFLESISLTKKTYGECYVELAEKLDKFISENEKMEQDAKKYFKDVVSAMKIWVEVSNKILNNSK